MSVYGTHLKLLIVSNCVYGLYTSFYISRSVYFDLIFQNLRVSSAPIEHISLLLFEFVAIPIILPVCPFSLYLN